MSDRKSQIVERQNDTVQDDIDFHLGTAAVAVIDPKRARFTGVSVRLAIWGGLLVTMIAAMVSQAFPSFRVLPVEFFPESTAFSGATAMLFVFLVALICEYIDSALGMGYGTTLMPILFLAGFNPLVIVPCILLSELISGFAAGVMHQKDGNVDFRGDRKARRTVMLLSSLSALGAIVAACVAISIPVDWLKGFMAAIIISVGLLILLTLRYKLPYRASNMVILGTIAAFNKGLSGGGYGPLVTSGQIASGLGSKNAIAVTSIAEAVTCLVGLLARVLVPIGLFYFLGWGELTKDATALLSTAFLPLALPLTLGAIMSVPVATLTVRILPEHLMRPIVGIATCVLGLWMACKLAGWDNQLWHFFLG